MHLDTVLHSAHQNARHLLARLDDIEVALNEGVARMAPLMRTPAGVRTILRFLADKQRDILAVLADGKQATGEMATKMMAVGGQYAPPPQTPPAPAPSPATSPSAGGDPGEPPPAPAGQVRAVDFKTDGPGLLPPEPLPQPPSPGPPPGQPQVHGMPAPYEDFTRYTVNGQPVPRPPAPNVTPDQLRQAIINQTVEYREFVQWFNKTYGGNVSPGDLAARVAAFQGSTIGTLSSLAGWPEAIPGTIAGLLGMFASGWSLFSVDPGTARIPEPGPP